MHTITLFEIAATLLLPLFCAIAMAALTPSQEGEKAAAANTFTLGDGFRAMAVAAVVLSVGAQSDVSRALGTSCFVLFSSAFWNHALFPHRRARMPSMVLAVCLMTIVTAFSCWNQQLGIESKRVTISQDHMRRLQSALMQYADAHHGELPPACIRDSDGKPMHSWRILLLPYLDEMNLYMQYSFSEPWDGANNRKLADQMPSVFAAQSPDDVRGLTGFAAIVGDHTAWPPNRRITIEDVVSQPPVDSTVILIAPPGLTINWLEPRDVTVADLPLEFTASPVRRNNSFLPATVVAGFLTWQRLLPADLDDATVKALVTVGERTEVSSETVFKTRQSFRYPFWLSNVFAFLLAMESIAAHRRQSSRKVTATSRSVGG